MQDETRVVSEARAAAVWRRAAELQAEAVKRTEAASPQLQLISDGAEAGFRVEDVRAAAAQAGISGEFVTLALAESEGIDARGFKGAGSERAATRVLGTPQRSIEVSRRIVGDPATLVEAMNRVLPAAPYLLSLSDTIGANPLNGGVLVFDVPSYIGMSGTSFAYDAAMIGVKQLRLMLRSAGGEGTPPATDVSIAVDLRRGARHTSVTAVALGGMAGTLGGVGGAALGIGVLALGALAALPAVAGVALAAAPVTFGLGAVYRYYIRKLTANLEGMLQSIDAQVRTGGVFSPPKRGDTPPNPVGLAGLPGGLL